MPKCQFLHCWLSNPQGFYINQKIFIHHRLLLIDNFFFFFLPAVKVKEGDKVEKGQAIAVLSAMKMEMVVQAAKAGTVTSVAITNGQKLEGDDLICTIAD